MFEKIKKIFDYKTLYQNEFDKNSQLIKTIDDLIIYNETYNVHLSELNKEILEFKK
jgi:hypothetical protein